jgi:hypothetical protein
MHHDTEGHHENVVSILNLSDYHTLRKPVYRQRQQQHHRLQERLTLFDAVRMTLARMTVAVVIVRSNMVVVSVRMIMVSVVRMTVA